MAQALRRIPVTILTGFLGAGKTTLLRRMLTAPEGLRIAVIENEFAHLDIDASLIKGRSEETIELKNGCVCCSIHDELMASLLDLATRRERFDQLVIETTGVANPASLVEAFLADPLIRVLYRLNAVVTLVDCLHFSRHFGESADYRDQIAYADLLVLNKVDLASACEIGKVEAGSRSLNGAAEVVRASHGEIPLSQVFDRFHYDRGDVSFRPSGAGHASELPASVSSLSLEVSGEIDEEKFMAWLKPFVAKHHDRMYRTKGVFSFKDHEKRVVVQGVHAIFSAVAAEDELPERGKSRVVFIGRDLPKEEILAGIRSSVVAALNPAQFALVPAGFSPRLEVPGGDFRIRIF